MNTSISIHESLKPCHLRSDVAKHAPILEVNSKLLLESPSLITKSKSEVACSHQLETKEHRQASSVALPNSLSPVP